MNISLGQSEHFETLLAGFENLQNGLSRDEYEDRYLRSCLALNGPDMHSVAGNEGFVDTVKTGAKKFYEMIKNFLKMIRDFLFGGWGKKSDTAVAKAVAQAEVVSKELPKALNKAEPAVVEKIEKIAEEKLEPVFKAPLPAAMKGVSEKYTANQHGFMTDLKKAAEHTGIKLNDIDGELNAVENSYKKITAFLDRKKNGRFSGTVQTSGDAITLCYELKDLRTKYKTLATKVSVILDEFNELAHTLSQEASKEKEYRAANKVAIAMSKLDNELGKAVDGATGVINKLTGHFGPIVDALSNGENSAVRITSIEELDEYMGYNSKKD